MSLSQASKNHEWDSKIEQWRQSGQSARAWCKDNEVVYTTFMGWRHRLTQRQKSNRQNLSNSSPQAHFVELKDKPPSSSGIRIEYEGVQIHLSMEFDPLVLKKCLQVLRGIAC